MFETTVFTGLTEAQASIVKYWQSRSVGQAMPRRDDIDPGVLRSHLAAISIVEIESDGGVRFRIAGSGLRNVLGQEMRGRRLSEVHGEAADMWSLGLTAVLERGVPVGGIIDRANDRHSWLRLPLIGLDGAQIVLCHDVLMVKKPCDGDEAGGQSYRVQILAA
jgi:hypothetical protein